MAESDRNILELKGIVKRFGGLVATDHLSLEVREDELHALIGPNGAGKTTLISQLLGHLTPNEGAITFAGRDITRLPAPQRSLLGIARSFQLTALCPSLTVLENVVLAVQAHRGHNFRFWRSIRDDESLLQPARAVIADVGLARHENDSAESLSHGQQRRLDIAMATATAPKLLLLDEPLAGLGPGEATEMVEYIRTLKGKLAIVMVEHDMDAVFALADRVSVLDLGRCIATGTCNEVKCDVAVRKAYLGESDDIAA
jgi:branched-chain amino acid transport system ATP-binding protein